MFDNLQLQIFSISFCTRSFFSAHVYIHLSVRLSICTSAYLSYPLISPSILPIHPNTHSCHPFTLLSIPQFHPYFCQFTYSHSALICAPIQKPMGLSIYQPSSCPSTHPHAYPLNYLLLHSPVCPLTRPYIPYLSIHRCTHSSINPSIPLVYTLAYETLTCPSSHLHLLD